MNNNRHAQNYRQKCTSQCVDLETLKEKINKIENDTKNIESIISHSTTNDSKILKSIGGFLTLSTALIGLFAAATYKVNTDSVNKMVYDAKEEISKLTSSTYVNNSDIFGTVDRDTVSASITYDTIVNAASGLISYKLFIDIPFLVSINEDNPGCLVGYKISFSGKILSEMASNSDGAPNPEIFRQYSSGINQYIENQTIVSLLPVQISHKLSVHRKTCEQISKSYKDLIKDRSSTITITPVFLKQKAAGISRTLKVNIYDNNVWSCDEILSHVSVARPKNNK